MEQSPPSDPEPSSRKGVAVVVAIAAGAVLIGGGIGIAYLAGAFDRRGPEQTIRDYYAALEEADCDRIIGLFTESSWNPEGVRTRQEVVAECEELDLATPQFEIDIRVLSNDDNQAMVEVDRRIVVQPVPRDLPTAEFELRREDGQWRIHGPAIIEHALGTGILAASHAHHSYPSQAT